MTENAPRPPSHNPFGATYVAPGSQEYRLPAALSWSQLYARFQSLNRRAAVLGPHGAGKTTLLTGCYQHWRSEAPTQETWHGFQVRNRRENYRLQWEARPGNNGRVSFLLKPLEQVAWTNVLGTLGPHSITMIDGFDAWPLFWRWRLVRLARRRDAGLLVTTHRPSALPCLIELKPTLADLQQLLANWQPQAPEVDEATLSEIWQRNRGNLRECLFALYDWWEREVRAR